MPAARPTQTAVRNALAAWQAAGLPVGRLTIGPRGEIIIEALPDAKDSGQGRGPKQWTE